MVNGIRNGIRSIPGYTRSMRVAKMNMSYGTVNCSLSRSTVYYTCGVSMSYVLTSYHIMCVWMLAGLSSYFPGA